MQTKAISIPHAQMVRRQSNNLDLSFIHVLREVGDNDLVSGLCSGSALCRSSDTGLRGWVGRSFPKNFSASATSTPSATATTTLTRTGGDDLCRSNQHIEMKSANRQQGSRTSSRDLSISYPGSVDGRKGWKVV